MPGVFQGDNTVRFAEEGVCMGTTWANIFYFTVPGGISGVTFADVVTLGGQLSSAYYTNLLHTSMHSTDTQLRRWKIKLIDGTSTEYRASGADNGAGTSSGALEAAQVCYLIDWVTTDPRRGGKARTYLPGVLTSALADNANLSSAALAAINTEANNFHNAVNALTITGQLLHMVEMSFINNKAPRAHGVGYEILAGVASNVVGTQRRRVDRLRIT
jgi:hypothetical protein